MSTAEVGIAAHRVRAWVGVEKHEKSRPQDLFFDVSVRYDIAEAIEEDHLSRAVDYTRVAEIVDAVVERRHYHLIETIAALVIDALLERFSQIEWVRIRIEKPQSIPTAAYSYVEMERAR